MESKATIVILTVFCVIIALAGIIFALTKRAESLAPVEGIREDAPPAAVKKAPSQDPVKQPPSPGATEGKQEAKPLPVVQEESYELGTKEDRSLIMELVNEPEMPMTEEKGKKFNYVPLQKGGGFLFERRDKDGTEITGVVIPGFVLVTNGYVELFGCGGGGKTHETIIQLECDIQTLDLSFTLSGFERGPLPNLLKEENSEQGTRVLVLVQWKDKDGKIITRRSEDLVISIVRKKTMPRIGWTYVGKWEEVENPADPDRKDKVLGAAISRSLVTTWRDVSSLLDNPLPEAPDDSQYTANYMSLPRSGTPVQVIFRTPTRAEREAIAKLEKEIATSEPIPMQADDRGHDHEDQ